MYDLKIFAKTIEQEATTQIYEMVKSPLCKNSKVRIMPDVHAGKGCVIGTTMTITDKVCPNIVGVDIGCGVDLVKTNIDFSSRLNELDGVIKHFVPSGRNRHSDLKDYSLELIAAIPFHEDNARSSLGTLGGGNHFIEAYNDGYLAVHSGSRNLGLQVAKYYQEKAEQQLKEYNQSYLKNEMLNIPKEERETWLKENKVVIKKELSYLQGDLMGDYLHDMELVQKFAVDNRKAMLKNIVEAMNGQIEETITSTHNYIDVKSMILRKGAISANKGEKLVIPLNMRDGIFICVGKGNEDWNYSAPHGCGRLYSRSVAKKTISLEDFKTEMEGIYSTTVCTSTIDEAPQAYKDFEEIANMIVDTVDIEKHLTPIYNFKAVE